MVKERSAEFFTVEFELLVRGDNMLAKKADISYAKALTPDTVFSSVVSGLRILGKP